MNDVAYAERDVDDVPDFALEDPIWWIAQLKLIALWLLMLLPLAWGVAETLKDISRPDPGAIKSDPSAVAGRDIRWLDRSVIPRSLHREFRASIARR